ncbi:hypothetical protein ACQJBY_027213 [Aegilops geniculata]
MLQALLTCMRSPAISDQHICSVVSMCFVSYRSRPKASSCSGSGTSKEAFSDKEAAGRGRRQRRCRQPQAPPRGRQKRSLDLFGQLLQPTANILNEYKTML